MKIESTPIKDCFILTPKVFKDKRGYFFERYNKKKFEAFTGLSPNFVQDNVSFSQYGVIRGLHAQKGNAAQAKIVSITQGSVLDVVVDNRPQSKTYGQAFSAELSAENKKQLFVPRGLLHGFAVLSETAKFMYKCDNYYAKTAEIGVRYDDPDLDIDWKIPLKDRVISEKDSQLPFFKTIKQI